MVILICHSLIVSDVEHSFFVLISFFFFRNRGQEELRQKPVCVKVDRF